MRLPTKVLTVVGAVLTVIGAIVALYGVLFHEQILVALAGETPVDRTSYTEWVEAPPRNIDPLLAEKWFGYMAFNNRIEAAEKQARDTVNPVIESRFAGHDYVICGEGWSDPCMKLVSETKELLEAGPWPRVEIATSDDRALCAEYYGFFIRTGRHDPYVDHHCFERWLRPQMVPDPSR